MALCEASESIGDVFLLFFMETMFNKFLPPSNYGDETMQTVPISKSLQPKRHLIIETTDLNLHRYAGKYVC